MDRITAAVEQYRLWIGVGLFAFGLIVSIALAVLGSQSTEPNAAESALLVIVGALCNVGGAWAISRRPGSPNLTASRTAIRHLAAVTTTVGQLASLADGAFEARPAGKSREDIGQLSWRLSDVEVRLAANVEDWTKAYPDLLENVVDDKSSSKATEVA